MKLLIDESDLKMGEKDASRAASISQSEGILDGVNRENVIWYVEAYLNDLVDLLDNISNISLGMTLCGLPHVVELIKYASEACSSANIFCNSFAMYVDNADALDELAGIWFGE